MSCVRESSPQPELPTSQRPELPKRKRFHPLKGLRRIFRRKVPVVNAGDALNSGDDIIAEQQSNNNLESSRSRSTSQLIDEPFNKRRSLHSTLLSVSHDSVFNPEQHSGQSDSESAVSVPRLGFPPQANIMQAELLEAVRRRRKLQDDDDSDDVDEEDLGLPRSPSMHSPTIATGNDLLLSKELINKSSHSTCSDGSLLSMGSSEMDEDSFGGHISRNSSKVSLHDKRLSQIHLDSSDGDSSTSVPLSHSAAKHRMAIRPKRKHGNPRTKKPLTVVTALPATPEVEEHSGRSASPETKPQTDIADGTICTIHDLDTCVDEISVENVPKREEGFFHRLLSRRSTKKKTKSEDDVDKFLFDEAVTIKPRQRNEPPPASRMQISYPPDLPLDRPTTPPLHMPLAEDILEPDTFTPIKKSFSLRQTDDELSSDSVQKSSSSDSVSSVLDDHSERCRSYSSSDSEPRILPVPAPRLSKLGSEVLRRKKREDEPELLKVFARRSLKLGKDGEPELLSSDKENECISLNEETENESTIKSKEPKIDVNENQTEIPRFKRIQQRREEWEKRLQNN
ncbi:uncharacterized protein LOC126908523 [Daktulosphaira vitifoliae]|uniref:uncharacterized protein LOC126908523 n=1 Tax=Daktulosphaira vitifoliae TaxID=58002 RepID=UPI0021AA3CD0|nr:uncharacterized protein LOC126908523 [Daktulosphaira vitifoliae]